MRPILTPIPKEAGAMATERFGRAKVRTSFSCSQVLLKAGGALLLTALSLPAQESQSPVAPPASSDLRDEMNPGYVSRPSTAQPALGDVDKAADQAFFEEAFRELSNRQRPWNLRYGAETRWMMDSNTRLSDAADGVDSDNSYNISPYAQFLYGSKNSRLQWYADYRLTATFFEKFQDENAINQFATTKLTVNGAKFKADANLTLRSVRGGDLDVGGQAQRDQLLAITTLTYQASTRSLFGLMGSSDLSDYQGDLQGFQRDLAGVFYDYLPSAKLSVGAQINSFWDRLEEGPDQTGLQYLGRLNWLPTSKLTVQGSAGWEQRSAGDYEGGVPIFNFSARYALSSKLALTLSGYRNAMMSPTAGNRFFYRTGGTGALKWDLGARWSLALTGGVEDSIYETSELDVPVSRQDFVWFVRPNVQYRLGSHVNAEVFFQRTVNDSQGTDGRGFDRDLFGVGLNFTF